MAALSSHRHQTRRKEPQFVRNGKARQRRLSMHMYHRQTDDTAPACAAIYLFVNASPSSNSEKLQATSTLPSYHATPLKTPALPARVTCLEYSAPKASSVHLLAVLGHRHAVGLRRNKIVGDAGVRALVLFSSRS